MWFYLITVSQNQSNTYSFVVCCNFAEQTTEGLNESERTNNHHCSCSGVADGRARPFFTEREKVYLQGLVRKYGLQQNSTFLGSVAAKRQAWVRLAKEFNSKECNTRVST